MLRGFTDQNHLRGVQIADADGKVRFTSIFPACCPGRGLHIHFEPCPARTPIADATTAIATSQVILPKNACGAVHATAGWAARAADRARPALTSDTVFGDDGGASRLGAITGTVAEGRTVALTAGVDTTTTPIGEARVGRSLLSNRCRGPQSDPQVL